MENKSKHSEKLSNKELLVATICGAVIVGCSAVAGAYVGAEVGTTISNEAVSNQKNQKEIKSTVLDVLNDNKGSKAEKSFVNAAVNESDSKKNANASANASAIDSESNTNIDPGKLYFGALGGLAGAVLPFVAVNKLVKRYPSASV